MDAPKIKSTRHPRAVKASANVNKGAAPYPPPTRTQGTGSFGRLNGLPKGPTKLIGSFRFKLAM